MIPSVDWPSVLQALGSLATTAIMGVAAIYLPRGIKAFEQISGVQLSAQQQSEIYASAQTAANLLVSHIEQGLVPLASATDPNHPIVTLRAMHAMNRMPPTAVSDQRVTASGMSQIIAGKIAAAYPTPPSATEMAARDVKAGEDQPVIMGGRPFGGPIEGSPSDIHSNLPPSA